MARTFIARGKDRIKTVKSQIFDIDNGNGTTVDETILRPTRKIILTAARIVYDDAQTGTVAAGNARIGVAVAGATIVASTSLENTKAVGTTTAMTLLLTSVAAGTPIIVRHTGVAATVAGKYHVELDYYEAT